MLDECHGMIALIQSAVTNLPLNNKTIVSYHQVCGVLYVTTGQHSSLGKICENFILTCNKLCFVKNYFITKTQLHKKAITSVSKLTCAEMTYKLGYVWFIQACKI